MMACNDHSPAPTGNLFPSEDLPPAAGRRRRSSVEAVKRNASLEVQRADSNKIAFLAERSVQIEQEAAKAAGQVGYLAQWMVHASLPYVQPKGDPPVWLRQSGKLCFTLQPGYYQKEVQVIDARGRPTTELQAVSYGYPYGAMPRLILAWLSTDVAIRKQRNVYLGASLVDFMNAIGKRQVTGGERGTITAVKDMMQRLFTSSMNISSNPLAPGRWTSEGFHISDSASIEECWNPLEPHKQSLWKSEVMLTEKFFESLLKSPVPVDMRILVSLSRSPIAMDIYSWLTYRFSHVSRDTLINWELLIEQFGTGTRDKYKFRELFERHLRSVLTLYPRARVETNHSGVLLRPSPTSVPRLVVPATALPGALAKPLKN